SRRVRLRNARLGDALHEQALLPGLAVRALRYAHERDVVESQRLEHCVHLTDLAEATIDEKQIRSGNLSVAHTGIASLQRLTQRPVIVAGCDSGDVEATVFLLHGPLGTEYDTGGDGALASGVADVEAFDPGRRLGQIEYLGERGEHFLHALLL